MAEKTITAAKNVPATNLDGVTELAFGAGALWALDWPRWEEPMEEWCELIRVRSR
jgi:hypothetical protein